MAYKTQRVQNVMNNFMSHHKEGYTIAEIADKYSVSKYTIYGILQEIADANGVDRDSLLEKIHSPHVRYGLQQSRELADFDETKALATKLHNRVNSLIQTINSAL